MSRPRSAPAVTPSTSPPWCTGSTTWVPGPTASGPSSLPPGPRPNSSYPLLNLFWTMFIFFLWVIWIWILITVFIDIFRSHDLSGWAKALWFLFVLFIPLIGVLVYLIARGGSMGERSAARAQQ
jgi:Phospholipase_D-nuclease N-terminal